MFGLFAHAIGSGGRIAPQPPRLYAAGVKSNLVVRVLTTLILLPLVLLIVHLGGWYLFVLLLAGGAIAINEYGGIVSSEDRTARLFYLAVATAALGLSMLVKDGVHMLVIVQASWIVLALFFLLRTGEMSTTWHRLTVLHFGVMYISLSVASLYRLREEGALLQHSVGAAWLYFVLMLSWMNDTCAYFAGRAFGKHKLYPKVSPKKTWEGFVGGGLGAIAFLFALVFLTPSEWFGDFKAIDLIILAVPAIFLSPAGDLVESLLKRGFNTKDAGSILPGHGGVLDRVDATFFVGPWVLLYATVLRPLVHGVSGG